MTMYQQYTPLTPTNNRLDFLKQTPSAPKKHNNFQSRNDRLDFLRSPPAPKKRLYRAYSLGFFISVYCEKIML